MAPLHVLWDGEDVDVESLPPEVEPIKRRDRGENAEGARWRSPRKRHGRRDVQPLPRDFSEGRGPKSISNGGSQW